jgi:hypothetical protein
MCHISKICYHTTFQELTLSDASVAPTSEVPTAAKLVLLMVGNKKVQRLSAPLVV